MPRGPVYGSVQVMRLKSLTLRNFRGFERFDLALDPEVTVLVGVNGAGKTSLLDAVSLMLSCLANGVRTGQPVASEVPPNDVRLGASTAVIELTAAFDGGECTWKVAKTLPGHPPSDADDLSQLAAPIEEAQQTIAAGRPRIPLAVYFPTNRNALDIPARIRTPSSMRSAPTTARSKAARATSVGSSSGSARKRTCTTSSSRSTSRPRNRGCLTSGGPSKRSFPGRASSGSNVVRNA